MSAWCECFGEIRLGVHRVLLSVGLTGCTDGRSVGASRSHRRPLVAPLLRSRRGSRRPRRTEGRPGSGRRPTGVACRATPSRRGHEVGVRLDAIGSVGAVGDGVGWHGAPVSRARPTSIARRWAIVTSHASTLASSGSDGYAFIAERNVSDQASSASAAPTTARQTRSTVGPCLSTMASNGSLLDMRSTLGGGPERARRWCVDTNSHAP